MLIRGEGLVFVITQAIKPKVLSIGAEYLTLFVKPVDGRTQYWSNDGSGTATPAGLYQYYANDPTTGRALSELLAVNDFELDVTDLTLASAAGRCDGQLIGTLKVGRSPDGSFYDASGPVALPIGFTRDEVTTGACGRTDTACSENTSCCSGYCRPSNNTCQ